MRDTDLLNRALFEVLITLTAVAVGYTVGLFLIWVLT